MADDIGTLEADARALVADASRVKNADEVSRLLKRLPMHSALPRAKALLALVAPHVSSCVDFSARDIAFALYGLNGFGMDVPGMTLVLSAMPRHIVACRDAFSAQGVSMSLYGLRRCKAERGIAYIGGVLAKLVPHILRCREPFKARHIGNSLYGLQGCSSEHADVRALLRAFAPQIERCRDRLDAQAVGNSLLGLQGCSSEHAEVRTVLRALAPHIEQCNEPLSAQGVSNSLYGLQGCSSEHAEVRTVLRALAPQIEQCKEPLSAQGVSNSLYGLQGCSSEHAEVRTVLRALAPQIEQCKEPLNAQGVGMTMYGLKGCSSQHAEVRAVLRALTPQIEGCKMTLDKRAVGNSLLGLQGCSSEHAEVRAVLRALAPQIERCKEPLDAQTVSKSLFGLQGCSSEHVEVRAVLRALAPQIELCKQPLSAQEVGNALYGLHSCSSKHAEKVLVALTPQLHRLMDQLRCALHSSNPDGLYVFSAADLLPVTHGCAAILRRPEKAPPSSMIPLDLLESLYIACARQLESCPVESLQTSESETRFRARAVALFSSVPLAVSVRPNACYLHGFEAGIVIIVHPPSGTTLAPVTVNIEVDGRMHRDGKSRLFCAVRDAHLRSRGVAVLHWNLLAKYGESELAFDTWLGRKINALRFRSLSLVPPPASEA